MKKSVVLVLLSLLLAGCGAQGYNYVKQTVTDSSGKVIYNIETTIKGGYGVTRETP